MCLIWPSTSQAAKAQTATPPCGEPYRAIYQRLGPRRLGRGRFRVGASVPGRRWAGLGVGALCGVVVVLTVTRRLRRLGYCAVASSGGPAMNGDVTREHYARLAATYDDNYVGLDAVAP